MAPESPSIVQRTLVRSPAAEDDHHAIGRARRAQRGRVVDAHRRQLPAALEFGPRKGRLLQVQRPHIIDGLRACVAALDDQVGLYEDHGVAVAAAGGVAHDLDREPLRVLVAVAQVEHVQVVIGESSS